MPNALLDALYRYGEPAAGLLSGMVAEPVAGWAGLLSGDAGAVQRTRDALTYQPRTAQGQQGMNALAGLLSDAGHAVMQTPIGDAVNGYNKLADMAGAYSPALGAAVKTAPAALGLLAGPGSGVVRDAFGNVARDAMMNAGRTGVRGPLAMQRGMIDIAGPGDALRYHPEDVRAAVRQKLTPEAINALRQYGSPDDAPLSAVMQALQQSKGLLDTPAMSVRDYGMDHRPMTVEGGAAPLHDLASSFGDDIYSRDALQYFGSGDAREKQVMRVLNQTRGNPDAMVTVYRGIPAGADGKINPGDWVTLSPEYAAENGDRVIKMQVPAAHVTAWPDSLLENGYWPTPK